MVLGVATCRTRVIWKNANATQFWANMSECSSILKVHSLLLNVFSSHKVLLTPLALFLDGGLIFLFCSTNSSYKKKRATLKDELLAQEYDAKKETKIAPDYDDSSNIHAALGVYFRCPMLSKYCFRFRLKILELYSYYFYINYSHCNL